MKTKKQNRYTIRALFSQCGDSKDAAIEKTCHEIFAAHGGRLVDQSVEVSVDYAVPADRAAAVRGALISAGFEVRLPELDL